MLMPQSIDHQSRSTPISPLEAKIEAKKERVKDHDLLVINLPRLSTSTLSKLASHFNNPSFPFLEEQRVSGKTNEASTTKAAVLQEPNGEKSYALARLGPGKVQVGDIEIFPNQQDFLRAPQHLAVLAPPTTFDKGLTYLALGLSFIDGTRGEIPNDGRDTFLKTVEQIKSEGKLSWITPTIKTYAEWAKADVSTIRETNCYGLVFVALRESNLLSQKDFIRAANLAQERAVEVNGGSDDAKKNAKMFQKFLLASICREQHRVDLSTAALAKAPIQAGDVLYFTDDGEMPKHAAIVTDCNDRNNFKALQVGGINIENREFVAAAPVNEVSLNTYVQLHDQSLADKGETPTYGGTLVICKVFSDDKTPKIEL
jgi:hypothetical protein